MGSKEPELFYHHAEVLATCLKCDLVNMVIRQEEILDFATKCSKVF